MLRAQVTAINKRKEIIFIRVIRCLNDNFDWALRRALAAVRTLLIINYRQVVINMDGIILTLLDAECTADTSVIAFSLDSRSLFMGITLYNGTITGIVGNAGGHNAFNAGYLSVVTKLNYRFLPKWNAFVKGMKLKAIGVSNFYPHVLANFCETVRVKPMVNQVELHPYFAQPEALATMKYYNVQPEAWAPLGGGRHKPFENNLLQSIADAHQKSISQVILRWNIQRGVVVIPKSTHQQRIEENFAIWDFSLTEKEMAQISSLDLGYVGESVKHFNPEFVRGCLAVKTHG